MFEKLKALISFGKSVSPAWSLDKTDLLKLVRNSAVVAAIAVCTYLGAELANYDLGVWEPVAAWMVTTALDFFKKLKTDNTKE